MVIAEDKRQRKNIKIRNLAQTTTTAVVENIKSHLCMCHYLQDGGGGGASPGSPGGGGTPPGGGGGGGGGAPIPGGGGGGGGGGGAGSVGMVGDGVFVGLK